MRITYGPRADVAIGTLCETDWNGFVSWLGQHPRPASHITLDEYPTLAAARSDSAEGQRLAAAKSGPWVCLAEYDGNRRHLSATPRGCAVALDLDYSGLTPSDITSRLIGFAFVAYTTFGHTASKPRWRVIVPTAGTMDAATHRATWAALNALFGNTADVSAKDVTRLNYLPGPCLAPADAMLFAQEGDAYQVVPAPPDQPPAPSEGGDGPVEGWRGPLDDDELIRKACAIVLRPEERLGSGKSLLQALWEGDGDILGDRFPPKESHQRWENHRATMALINELMYFTGNDAERVERLAAQAGCTQQIGKDHERKIGAALAIALKTTREPYTWPAPIVLSAASVDPEAVVAAPDIETAMGLLDLTRKNSGQFAPTLLNVTQVLAIPQMPRLAYDTFRGEVMIAPCGTNEWRPVDDVLVTRLLMDFERMGFAPIAVDYMRRAIDEVGHRQQFDSAVEWLDALVWDGVPRIDRFLPLYAGTDDDDYNRAVSAYLWTALAGRALVPGIKADMVPVLIGVQGSRKTSSLEALVPDPDHYSELSLLDRDTDTARLMRGKLVCEIGELRGLSKRDLESVKSFITRRHEQWIPKYREFAITFPWRSLLIGTTNQSQFLEDDTGNRRWLPITVRNFNREAVERDRLQLWAEAAVRFKAGGIAWRDAELLAQARHVVHMVTDSWEVSIERWVDETPAPSPGSAPAPAPSERPFHIAEVLAGALRMKPEQMNRAAEQRAGRVLRSLGYDAAVIREGSKTVRRWRKL
ncbi:MAG: VapE domain-containing protein [Steroidobacteraceae bacterium]